jgi:hypothetical protein
VAAGRESGARLRRDSPPLQRCRRGCGDIQEMECIVAAAGLVQVDDPIAIRHGLRAALQARGVGEACPLARAQIQAPEIKVAGHGRGVEEVASVHGDVFLAARKFPKHDPGVRAVIPDEGQSTSVGRPGGPRVQLASAGKAPGLPRLRIEEPEPPPCREGDGLPVGRDRRVRGPGHHHRELVALHVHMVREAGHLWVPVGPLAREYAREEEQEERRT